MPDAFLDTNVLFYLLSADTRKADIAEALVAAVRACCRVAPLTEAGHDLALDLAARHGLAWYDALIVASALQSGAGTLLTEDLQHGQRFGGRLRVVDPFRG